MTRAGTAESKEPRVPGLLRGIARTAAVAGTATAVSNRVSRRQANRWASRGENPYGQPAYDEPEVPPTSAAGPGPDAIHQLKELAALRDQGVLTEEEFAQQKARILGT
jgi:hypothetical protein